MLWFSVTNNIIHTTPPCQTLFKYSGKFLKMKDLSSRDEGQGCDPEKGLLLSNSMLKHLSTQSDLNQIEGKGGI